MTVPGIALAPVALPPLEQAVEAGGGRVVEAAEADGLVWIDPRDPEGLSSILASADPRWVQLPFAGVESFFDAGVITDERVWTCTKGIYGPATAEHALALLLAAARRLHEHARARTWREGYAQLGQPERRLTGATVLIVGTGGIGRALTEMLRPLGPRVIGVNRSGRVLEGAERTVTSNELLDVLPEADYVVVAAASTPSTQAMFGAEEFAAMKSTSWIVNVARGALIDTGALVEAVRSQEIRGAALDVTDPEPLPDDHPLWELDEVIVTPHVANTADMAVPELIEMVRRNVENFANDRPLEGLIDVSLGY